MVRQTPGTEADSGTIRRGSRLETFAIHDTGGDPLEQVDLKVQSIAQRGCRIIDEGLITDYTSDPPVVGWVLYEETTNEHADTGESEPERAG